VQKAQIVCFLAVNNFFNLNFLIQFCMSFYWGVIMSSLLSTFSCCFWWFLLGALLGWLLHHLLRGMLNTPAVQQVHTPAPVAAPVRAAEVPVAKAAPVAAPAATVIDLAAAKKAGFAIKNANDLTVVEGIGPKINELFNNAGIKTFVQLAAATVPQMRKILDDGGSRFRIANPSTWAQQAALAADNKWDALKKLQDELSAGLKK
jgi:predicted flap endonuclease-1-like 5' DNA nuclease